MSENLPSSKISTKATLSVIAGIINIVFVCLVVLDFMWCQTEYETSICMDLPTVPWTMSFLISLVLSGFASMAGRSAKFDIEKSNGMLGGNRRASLGLVLSRLGGLILLLAMLGVVILTIIAVGSI